jgi:hypothetical protein
MNCNCNCGAKPILYCTPISCYSSPHVHGYRVYLLSVDRAHRNFEAGEWQLARSLKDFFRQAFSRDSAIIKISSMRRRVLRHHHALQQKK